MQEERRKRAPVLLDPVCTLRCAELRRVSVRTYAILSGVLFVAKNLQECMLLAGNVFGVPRSCYSFFRPLPVSLLRSDWIRHEWFGGDFK